MILVVLGGGITKEGILPNNIILRLEKALEVYNREHFDTVILSGKYSSLYGLIRPKKTEAQAMADYLLKKGVPRDRMILEEQSKNTLANAYYVKKWFVKLKERGGTIVTSSYHLKRAEFVFRKTFGPLFHLSFVAAPHEFDYGTEKRVEQRQNYLLDKTKEFLINMKDGDDAYLRHRMYRFLAGIQVPEWVASFVSHG